MRVFVAGVIQGGRIDGGIQPQDYRREIADEVLAVFPGTEIVDPHGAHPDRLGWDRERQKRMFFRYITEAGRCDLLVAWLPEASMGTAVEMFGAHRAGVPVLAITPLAATWAVSFLAVRCLPDLAAFGGFIRDPEFDRLVGPAAGRARIREEST